jgi:hypothetical protein
MKKPIRIFALGMVVGLCAAFIMPSEWSDLSVSPGYAAWVIAPSFLLYMGLCLATLTDFISNDGASAIWLDALWALSVGGVVGGYALVFYALASRVHRRRG